MSTTTETKRIKVRSSVKAGGPVLQHNASKTGIKIRSSVKAGGIGIVLNHNASKPQIKK